MLFPSIKQMRFVEAVSVFCFVVEALLLHLS